MSELMIFIWVIGWLFTVGATLNNTRIHPDKKRWKVAAAIFIMVAAYIVIWPFMLGGMWEER